MYRDQIDIMVIEFPCGPDRFRWELRNGAGTIAEGQEGTKPEAYDAACRTVRFVGARIRSQNFALLGQLESAR